MYSKKETDDINGARMHGVNHTPTTYVGLMERQSHMDRSRSFQRDSQPTKPFFDDTGYGTFARFLLFLTRMVTVPGSLFMGWIFSRSSTLYIVENIDGAKNYSLFIMIVMLVAASVFLMLLADITIKSCFRQIWAACKRIW